MLTNATLLRIDTDPALAAGGEGIPVRCSLSQPTNGETAAASLMAVGATAVLYLPLVGSARTDPPAAGQEVTIGPDGGPPAVWRVTHVALHAGGALAHARLFLEAV